MKIEHVILVDQNDQEIGVEEKLQAHQNGSLHRAFSIFIFNKHKQLLLQKRHISKYHSGGLWTNTCCSHPRPSELTLDAAHRRLKEEMGFDCELFHAYSFIYHAELDNNLKEHEFDHVFIGFFNGHPKINRKEATDWAYWDFAPLKKQMKHFPGNYSAWLHLALDKTVKIAMTYFDQQHKF